MIKGIDLSSYQSETYSTKGFDFAFIKATEGVNYVNPKMKAQAAHARAAGLVVGFYHFVRPGSMVNQAKYFVDQAASLEGDILWLDWEDPGVSSAQKDQFLAEVKRLRGSSHRVGLYCSTSYWKSREKGSNAGDALWIAEYGVGAGHPNIKDAWLFHQYADEPVDTSVAQFASRAALKAWAAKTPAPTPAKPPASAPAKPKAPSTTSSKESTDMQLTDAVTLPEWVVKQWPDDKGLADKKIAVNTALASGYGHIRVARENTDAILSELKALRTEVAQLRAAVAKGA